VPGIAERLIGALDVAYRHTPEEISLASTSSPAIPISYAHSFLPAPSHSSCLLRSRHRSCYHTVSQPEPTILTTLPFLPPSNHSVLILRLPATSLHCQKQIRLTVDAQFAVPHNLLNLPLLLQIIQCFPRQTPIDLQPIHQRCHCYQAIRLHVLVEFVRGGFIEDDGVVGFVLDCSGREIQHALR